MLETPEEKAYAAGLIDADGSISINKKLNAQKRPVFWACVQLSMKEPSVIHWIADATGGRSVYEYTPNSPLASPDTVMYKVMWQGQSARDFLAAILPYLKGKEQQAVLACEFHDKKERPVGHRENANSLEERESYWKQVRVLNGRRFKGE